jgi:hypothetical protein
MSGQPPQDPYGQNPYNQGYPPGYDPQAYSGGYPSQPRQSLDLGKVVGIGAWVVLALFFLKYLYGLGQDAYGEDFADRFFGGMPELGTGIFYTGLLLGVALWLEKHRT